MKKARTNVLTWEYQRRLAHLATELGPRTPDREALWENRLWNIKAQMKKPLTVLDLRIMLGDHPEWFLVKIEDGALYVEDPFSENENTAPMDEKPRIRKKGKSNGEVRENKRKRRHA